MSFTAKGKYEVIRILRNSILSGLSFFGISDVECMEFAQPLLQSSDRVVLVKNSGQQRVGWQRQRYRREGVKFIKILEWTEEQKWDITVVMKRDGGRVSDSTETAEDVATMLISWFNGVDGVASLRKELCAPLIVQPSDVKPYKDDSQSYQNTATFSINLHVPKIFEAIQDTAIPLFKDTIGV